VESGFAAYFWGFLLLYGVVFYVISPKTRTVAGFFRGADQNGRDVSPWLLTSSIFISWIFAKSVANAANLGATYGVVGGLAYATYWLSIPVAGFVIYWLRTRDGAAGLVPYVITKYGRAAAGAFTIAILIRLYNEIWSNTSVVGDYFGNPGDASYIAAALVFTGFTLVYTAKGGLRASIITDFIQTIVFVFFLALVLLFIVPQHGVADLARAGEFRLETGLDLLLVALIQVLSYPFHDPVLTDRGFLTKEKAMLKSFVVAGVLGFVCIFAFSLVGVHAYLENIAASSNVTGVVARSFGVAALFATMVVMVSSAGSTLDSTFSSLSKNLAHELPLLFRLKNRSPINVGLWVMVAFALLGNLPMFFGTDILKATTVSGTMVMGLAPVFLLAPFVRYSPWSFHLSFWTGLAIGVLQVANLLPSALAIGSGKYGLLLGANVYGLALCTAGFLLPLALPRRAPAKQYA
jgi:solute:Na+ symporter, SSS family